MAQEGHAAEVGRDVLRAGGNAVDAAIATAFALAVTLPEAGNLGGGGFIVAYLADRQEVVTVDFREMAPQVGHADDVPRTPTASRGPATATGAWAAGVPGTVRGLGLAHARWGKRPWAELVRPAARLAREGFPISADLAGSLNRQLGRAGPDEHVDRDGTRATSAGWATFPSRSPPSASPTARPGRPATGSSRPTWPHPRPDRRGRGRTSSTPAGPPS